MDKMNAQIVRGGVDNIEKKKKIHFGPANRSLSPFLYLRDRKPIELVAYKSIQRELRSGYEDRQTVTCKTSYE